MPTWDAFSQGSDGETVTVASFTIADQSDRILLVCVCGNATTNPSTWTVSSVTWNTSENLSALGSMQRSGNFGMQWWYLYNPTATTASIVVTTSEAQFDLYTHVRVFSAYDVLQAAPNHYAYDSDNSVDVTSDTDEIVADTIFWTPNTADYSVGAGQTQQPASAGLQQSVSDPAVGTGAAPRIPRSRTHGAPAARRLATALRASGLFSGDVCRPDPAPRDLLPRGQLDHLRPDLWARAPLPHEAA